jgi:hypothetical protein
MRRTGLNLRPSCKRENYNAPRAANRLGNGPWTVDRGLETLVGEEESKYKERKERE